MWDPPNLIFAVILFVDQVDSVMLSNSLSLSEYDSLINDYQHTLMEVLNVARDQYCIAEAKVVGDELYACFYSPDDVETQARMNEIRAKSGEDSPEFREARERLHRNHNRHIYGALVTALRVKNRWISHGRNVERINSGKNPIEIGCGINAGRVSLANRVDGTYRVEGYAINYAKRVEGASRFGRSSHVALSRTAYEKLRKIRIKQFLLKQRIFFRPIEFPLAAMKGISAQESVFELTFFHALKSVSPDAEQAEIFGKIFWADPTNFWAYCNLIDYLLYDKQDYSSAEDAAEFALYSNPPSEKIYYDLANIHFEQGDYETAREYCLEALRLNEGFDLAYELLIDIELKEGKDPLKMLEYASKAVVFTPGSALNHFSLARAHYTLNNIEHARKHAKTMLKLHKDYAKEQEDVRDLLEKLDMQLEGQVEHV